MTTEPTIRELEALNHSIRDLNQTVKELRTEFSVAFVRKDVIEPQLKEIRDVIAKHASYWDWVVRIVLGTVIVALLGLVIAQGGGPT